MYMNIGLQKRKLESIRERVAFVKKARAYIKIYVEKRTVNGTVPLIPTKRQKTLLNL